MARKQLTAFSSLNLSLQTNSLSCTSASGTRLAGLQELLLDGRKPLLRRVGVGGHRDVSLLRTRYVMPTHKKAAEEYWQIEAANG